MVILVAITDGSVDQAAVPRCKAADFAKSKDLLFEEFPVENLLYFPCFFPCESVDRAEAVATALQFSGACAHLKLLRTIATHVEPMVIFKGVNLEMLRDLTQTWNKNQFISSCPWVIASQS